MKNPYLAGCFLAVLSFFSAAYAQNSQQPKKEENKLILEAATSAPWYGVAGPKITAGYGTRIGRFELGYVPLGESYEKSHDAHLTWKLPSGLVPNLDIELVSEYSKKRGTGGGIKSTIHAPDSVDFIMRFEGFRDVVYGEGRLNTKHLDFSMGAIKDHDLVQPYGYFTINAGRWDDTLTLGWGPDDILWNAFSMERNESGIVSINYYQFKTGNYTTDAFIGKGDLNRSWFTRDIDRLLAYNDVDPKERSWILQFPSYLGFAKWAGELRADRTGGKSFLNVGFGRTFKPKKLKGIKFGFGSGIEYIREPGNVMWQPNGELYLEIPLGKHSISLTKRFREKEGNMYAAFSYKF